MSKGLLDRLAKREIPPVPAGFDRGVHERVNRALLAAHLLDFMVAGVPYLVGHLSRAVVSFLVGSLTGKFEDDRRRSE